MERYTPILCTNQSFNVLWGEIAPITIKYSTSHTKSRLLSNSKRHGQQISSNLTKNKIFARINFPPHQDVESNTFLLQILHEIQIYFIFMIISIKIHVFLKLHRKKFHVHQIYQFPYQKRVV